MANLGKGKRIVVFCKTSVWIVVNNICKIRLWKINMGKWVFCVRYTENCAICTGFCIPYILKKLNFHLEPRTKILPHFKGSECEIAFLKFHFLLDIIMWKLWIITSRRKWNFKKAISPSEPLKCARILVLGSKWKFNILHKICPNFPWNVHRILCTMHRFLCTIHRKLICPYCKSSQWNMYETCWK